MKIIRIAILATAAILAVSCCGCRKGSSTTAGNTAATPLVGTTWQLIEIEGEKFSASGDRFTLVLGADERVSGKGDCNRLMGGYTMNTAGMLTFSRLASTMMYCPNQSDEDKYMKAFDTIDSYSIDGDLLALSGGGSTKMIFRKVTM